MSILEKRPEGLFFYVVNLLHGVIGKVVSLLFEYFRSNYEASIRHV